MTETVIYIPRSATHSQETVPSEREVEEMRVRHLARRNASLVLFFYCVTFWALIITFGVWAWTELSR